MDLQLVLEQRAKVEEFQRKHRIGLLTLLFTDLVSSTKLKQELGDREAVALIQQHHALVREVLSRFREGEEIGTAGDSFFIVFTKPSEAAQFSLLLQSRLRSEAQQTTRPLRDRIGIHIGEVVVEERPESAKPKDLYGLQVDICARVMSLAEGDQILLTRSAFDNARQVLKGQDVEGIEKANGLQWLNHGPYVLKGVEEPLEICEVGEAGAAALKPPPDSEKVHRYVSPDAEPVLGWRPAIDQAVPGTPWLLEEKLGEGGFGEVWLGRHQTLKERRVFKFCFRADRVRSLKREVTLFRLLRERTGEHPNIVKVHDVYLNEPPFYLMIDYVEGRDLRTWCEARGGIDKVPLATRLEIVAQIADALQAAHDAGVIHRDVKPSNILISQLIAKLTDFGIGQVVSEEALAGLTKLGFTQTMMSPGSSALTGTQMYMAPELAAGKPASMQSDIYSLGVVLFQLAVGDLSRPLTMDWPRDIEEPRLVNELVDCFAGDPQERFAAARQLAENLRSLKRHSDLLARWRSLARNLGTVSYRALLAIGVCMVLWGISGLCLLLLMVVLSWWDFRPQLLGFDLSRLLGLNPRLLITSTWIGVFAIYAARVKYRGGWPTAVGVLFCLVGWVLLISIPIEKPQWRLETLSPLLIFFILGLGLLRSGHKEHLRLSRMRKTSSISKAASWFGRIWAPAILAGSMVAFVIYSVQPSRPNYKLLYGRLDLTEAGRIITELGQMNLPYREEKEQAVSEAHDGVSSTNISVFSIYVPQDTVHMIRMHLASKGMPKGEQGGFEIFEKPGFGMSDFVQQANYRRAVQEELARSIVEIDGIESARVLIVAPESHGLLGPEKKAVASVSVKLRGNARLESRAVDAIRFLVANSIQGLEPSNVSVVDDAGNILSVEGKAGPTPAPH